MHQYHRNSWLAQTLGRLVLKITGWKVSGELPIEPRSVIIAAPHTSNWDFVFLIAATSALGVRIHWLGKDSLFNHPLGFIMHWLGGIPVNRSKRTRLVSQIAERFKNQASLHLVIPPAGTRARTDRWRSGFYHIAQSAKVPVIFGFLDYPKKLAGISKAMPLSGRLQEDMDRIRVFYADKVGKFPAMSSTIRLEEESDVTAQPAQPKDPS